MNKKLFFIFRVIVGFAILFALFKFIPYSQLVEIYKNSHKLYLFLGILVFYSCVYFGILRWKTLLSDLGINSVCLSCVFNAELKLIVFSSFFKRLFLAIYLLPDLILFKAAIRSILQLSY